ncbi:hypothetical protein PV326_007901 [Microctonus aethiopoides]|nr:hypothetical protein PV326_007901 [Microctonus aethiopoides]
MVIDHVLTATSKIFPLQDLKTRISELQSVFCKNLIRPFFTEIQPVKEHGKITEIILIRIQDVVEEIKSTGGECTGYVCNVANKKEVYRVSKLVKIEVGNVTIIVNNAGYVCGKTFMNIPDNEIEKTFKVNTLSHYWINKSFMNEMMKENHGHIVTVASVAGLLGTYNCTDYSAAKFAAVGYHESLFTELKVHGYHGIHTTLICPYFINTNMFPGVKPRLIAMLEPEYVAEEIVSAILTNEINVTMPRSTRYLLPLKSWMPAKLSWALMYNILQGPQTMMMLQKDRKVPKNKKDYVFS